MKRKISSILVAFVFIFSLPSLTHSKSQSHYQYVNSPESEIYFGHVSYVDVKYDGYDPVVIREGEPSPEIAVLNFPLAPGDTIRTTDRRRYEIQFDTGTIIRLDLNTELKLQTILAQSLSSKSAITNLVLNKGQIYIMYKKYNKREVFQVLTSNAAVKMKHNTVAFMNVKEDSSTDLYVKEGKVHILYGPDEYLLAEEKAEKSQKVTVSPDHLLMGAAYEPDVDFELWNENLNKNFMELHRGMSFIPAPVQRMNPALFHFAQKFSNKHGEWVWNSLYGWVWRPFFNDYYPWGNWAPYMYGQWRNINNELFWVPEESWGWVPYHLGLWVWNEKLGWLWIPGSAFAPAWVSWDYLMGYYSWRPWSMTDWYYYGGYYPGYGYSSGYYYPSYVSYYYGQDSEEGRKVLTRIRKDQLKKKDSSSYKLPNELKRIYERVVTAIKKGDERVLGPVRKISDHMITVRREDLNARKIQEKTIRLGDISRDSLSVQTRSDSYTEAVRAFNRDSMMTSLREDMSRGTKDIRMKDRAFRTVGLRTFLSKEELLTSMSSRGGAFREEGKGRPITVRSISPVKKTPSLRFRDWNPDAGVALRAGVSIKYVSRNNEIQCPELRMSSRNGRIYSGGRVSGARLTSSGGSSSGGSGGGSSSGSSRGGGSSGGSKGSSGSSSSSKGGSGRRK